MPRDDDSTAMRVLRSIITQLEGLDVSVQMRILKTVAAYFGCELEAPPDA